MELPDPVDPFTKIPDSIICHLRLFNTGEYIQMQPWSPAFDKHDENEQNEHATTTDWERFLKGEFPIHLRETLSSTEAIGSGDPQIDSVASSKNQTMLLSCLLPHVDMDSTMFCIQKYTKPTSQIFKQQEIERTFYIGDVNQNQWLGIANKTADHSKTRPLRFYGNRNNATLWTFEPADIQDVGKGSCSAYVIKCAENPKLYWHMAPSDTAMGSDYRYCTSLIVKNRVWKPDLDSKSQDDDYHRLAFIEPVYNMPFDITYTPKGWHNREFRASLEHVLSGKDVGLHEPDLLDLAHRSHVSLHHHTLEHSPDHATKDISTRLTLKHASKYELWIQLDVICNMVRIRDMVTGMYLAYHQNPTSSSTSSCKGKKDNKSGTASLDANGFFVLCDDPKSAIGFLLVRNRYTDESSASQLLVHDNHCKPHCTDTLLMGGRISSSRNSGKEAAKNTIPYNVLCSIFFLKSTYGVLTVNPRKKHPEDGAELGFVAHQEFQDMLQNHDRHFHFAALCNHMFMLRPSRCIFLSAAKLAVEEAHRKQSYLESSLSNIELVQPVAEIRWNPILEKNIVYGELPILASFDQVFDAISDHESLYKYVNDVKTSIIESQTDPNHLILRVHQQHSFSFLSLNIFMRLKVHQDRKKGYVEIEMIDGDMKWYRARWQLKRMVSLEEIHGKESEEKTVGSHGILSHLFKGEKAHHTDILTLATFEIAARPKIPAPTFILHRLGVHSVKMMLCNVREEIMRRASQAAKK